MSTFETTTILIFERSIFFILVLFDKLEKCNCSPFQNYSSKNAHLEVYRVGWPREEWAGPTHMGHTPTLQMGILQYKIGG